MQPKKHPFVDRKEAIALFRELLKPGTMGKPFLNFFGESGMGKSFLMEQLAGKHCRGWEQYKINFEPGGAAYTYEETLHDLAAIIARQAGNKKAAALFQQTEAELEKQTVHITNINKIESSNSSRVKARDINQQIIFPMEEGLARFEAEKQRTLTRAFLELYGKAKHLPLLIFIDATEQIIEETAVERETPEYSTWLFNLLIKMSGLSPGFRVCVCGRKCISRESFTRRAVCYSLQPLEQADIGAYLAKLDRTDPMLADRITAATGGYPLSVGMTGDILLDEAPGDWHGFFQSADFGQEYLNRMVPELTEELFGRFIQYSFIKKESRGCHYYYHAGLFNLLNKHRQEQQPAAYREQLTRIYHYFRNSGSDQQYYYGLQAGIEGVFEQWETRAYACYNHWHTRELGMLVEIIDSTSQACTDAEYSSIYFIKGRYYSRLYVWDKALEYYLKAEKITKAVGDKAGLGYTNYNIAALYYQQEDRRAVERIRSAVALFRELGAKAELAEALELLEAIEKWFKGE